MSRISSRSSPARRPGGVLRAALRVGGLFLVLSAVLLVLMTWQARRSVSQDPDRVVAAAGRILPGARPLEGQVGLFALEFWGTRMAVLGDPRLASRVPAPADPGLPAVPTTLLMAREGTDLKPSEELERLQAEMEERGYLPRGSRVIRREEVPFRAAGREVLGTRTGLETPRRERYEQFTLLLPGPRGMVLALFAGTALSPERVQRSLDGTEPPPR